MTRSIRYVAFYDENDERVSQIGRLINDESGLRGEILDEGNWVESKLVLDVICDPGFADIITYDEAKAIASTWGVMIE